MSLQSNPIVCYVSDRRSLAPQRLLPEVIRQATAAGVDWIQIREKDLPSRALAEMVRLALADTQGSRTRVLVNDRLDVAFAAHADGVHLGEHSAPVAAIAAWRRDRGADSVRNFTLGVSCHSLEAARAAERDGADYIFFGPIFATPSKASFGAPQGLDRLREVCAALRIPVVAIGGVTLENARSCALAGAAGIAAIRMFQDSQNMADLVQELRSHLANCSPGPAARLERK